MNCAICVIRMTADVAAFCQPNEGPNVDPNELRLGLFELPWRRFFRPLTGPMGDVRNRLVHQSVADGQSGKKVLTDESRKTRDDMHALALAQASCICDHVRQLSLDEEFSNEHPPLSSKVENDQLIKSHDKVLFF